MKDFFGDYYGVQSISVMLYFGVFVLTVNFPTIKFGHQITITNTERQLAKFVDVSLSD